MSIRITERLSEQPYQTLSLQKFKLAGVTVIASADESYNYGDVVKVEGKLQANAGNLVFRLLGVKYTDFTLMYPNISIVHVGEAAVFTQETGMLKVWRQIFFWRQTMLNRVREALGEPQAALILGMVWGQPIGSAGNFSTALRKTGTTHIVVASGMNVALVGGVVMQLLLRFFKRRQAAVGVVGVIWVYAVMVGMGAPIVRAAIMGSIVFVGQIMGRARDAGRVLVGAGLAMMWWNPEYITQAGWQLSFAATGGILWVGPILKRWFIDEVAVVMAAQMATLPLIIYHFGYLSWISPVANLLVTAVVPLITVAGGIWAVGLSIIGVNVLTRVVGWGLWVPLEYMVVVIRTLGKLPVVEVGKIPGWWVILAYLVILAWIWQSKRKSDRHIDNTNG